MGNLRSKFVVSSLKKTLLVAVIGVVLVIMIVAAYVASVSLATGTLKVEVTDPPAVWGVATQSFT